MKIYFLLRDNQETGPFSIDEMRSQNLKELDLIWKDGESITWKYPSEMKEFRAAAPKAAMHAGTFVNNRKERQIAYFNRNIAEMGFKKHNIESIIQPDAFVSDVPAGYEYLVMADQYRLTVDHTLSEQILESVFANQAEEKVAESKTYTVLGAPQVIDTAEVAAKESFFDNMIEMPLRYKAKPVVTANNVRKKRGPGGLGNGLAGWVAIIAAAFMHLKL